jgi:hypothetical protein
MATQSIPRPGGETAKRRLLLSVAATCAAVVLLVVPSVRIPVLDTQADRYFSESIAKTGVTLATCAVINAAVSVMKELELSAVVASIEPGEALDPVDDMVERLSEILMTAIAAFGVMRMLNEISVSLVPTLIGIALLGLAGLLWVDKRWSAGAVRVLSHIAMLLLACRLALSLTAVVDVYLQRAFFEQRIEEAKSALAELTRGAEDVADMDVPAARGLWGDLTERGAWVKSKSEEIAGTLTTIAGNARRIFDVLLELAWLYVAALVIQVILLPLGVVWAFVKTARIPFNSG